MNTSVQTVTGLSVWISITVLLSHYLLWLTCLICDDFLLPTQNSCIRDFQMINFVFLFVAQFSIPVLASPVACFHSNELFKCLSCWIQPDCMLDTTKVCKLCSWKWKRNLFPEKWWVVRLGNTFICKRLNVRENYYIKCTAEAHVNCHIKLDFCELSFNTFYAL